jgi:hypothetical protein
MEEKLRFPVDRRSGGDRRKIYNLVYARFEGNERRNKKEQRYGIERRKDWVKETNWSSVLR